MVPVLPGLVTGFALVLYFVTCVNVGRARGRYDVKPPATTGNPAFERIYRVQQNTLEQLILFLPSLWLCSFFLSPLWGAAIGLVWVLGRLYYAWSYYRDPEKRAPGFVIGAICVVVLLVGAFIGMLRAL
jgi:glutathione S-transferase